MKELYREIDEAEPYMATFREQSVDPMVYGQQISSRFSRAALTREPCTVFVPWGVRTAGTFGTADLNGLADINAFSTQLQRIGVPNEVLLMPADVYAVEVNGMDEEPVEKYFRTLTSEAESAGFRVKPWSEIRRENAQMYDSLVASRLRPDMLMVNMPMSIWYGTIVPTAIKRNPGVSQQRGLERGFAYLRERMAEAIIVDRLYQPVKFSMVSPNKDEFLDNPLPRLYLLPRDRRFPWLK